MRRWSADLALGVRLSVGGGRSGWARLVLIAVGVGLGVTMLLVAASVPTALDGRSARASDRSVESGQELTLGAPTLLTSEIRSVFHDQAVDGRLLQPEADGAPLPPGVTQQLAPGEVVLSPALARLMGTQEGAALAGRWGDRVVGTIGAEGLVGPGELTFYLGTDQLDPATADRIQSFGGAQTPAEGPDVATLLLALVGMVVLLLPVAIFVSTAVRFGSEAQDRRLAALRLVGADVAMTRRVAAGETLAGAVLGLAVGSAVYLAVRQVAGTAVPAGLSFFASDFAPLPVLAALIVVLVPVTTVLVTLSALRRVLVEPLGVVRRSGGRRRRLWWRLTFPALGVVLLHPLGTGLDTSMGDQILVVAGLVLLLVGVALVLPWLVEAVVRRIAGGGVAWDLAVRRLQLDSGTAVRSVSGIAVSVAGLIALQGLVGAIGALGAASQADAETFQATVLDIHPAPDAVATWDRELGPATGVTAVESRTAVWASAEPGGPADETAAGGTAGAAASDDEVRIESGTCSVLAQEAVLGSCDDGDVFVVVPNGAAAPAAGSAYRLDADAPDTELWTLPASAERAEPAPGGVMAMGSGPAAVLVTPGALDGSRLAPQSVTTYVALDPAVPDALEHLRTAAGQVDPRAYTTSVEQSTAALRDLRQVLLVGTVALLAMVGASMLVNVVEQLRERRRLLAVLVAFGTRRRTLSGSVLFQVTIPVVLGLALAVVTGTGLALALQSAVDAPITFDWVGIGTTSAAAALVVLLTTAAGLPLLWRLTRPTALRDE